MIKTFADAQDWLRSQGFETELTSFGLRGTLTLGEQSYSFKVARFSGGGKEVGVQPESGHLCWWFWNETLEGVAHLLVDARARVENGSAASWLEALCGLDSTLSALWPQQH
ncbi:hypothetical protein DRW03_34650 [Corallococcus sp. H22C18031201]|nr:hypothetical protein DRW03_34650 [Corallococcus sp. H22C18031201]